MTSSPGEAPATSGPEEWLATIRQLAVELLLKHGELRYAHVVAVTDRGDGLALVQIPPPEVDRRRVFFDAGATLCRTRSQGRGALGRIRGAAFACEVSVASVPIGSPLPTGRVSEQPNAVSALILETFDVATSADRLLLLKILRDKDDRAADLVDFPKAEGRQLNAAWSLLGPFVKGYQYAYYLRR